MIVHTRKGHCRHHTQHHLPSDPMISLTGQLAVSVQDYEVHLELILHTEIPYLDALTALHGKTVQVILVYAAPVQSPRSALAASSADTT